MLGIILVQNEKTKKCGPKLQYAEIIQNPTCGNFSHKHN